jgi:hypothetical protein
MDAVALWVRTESIVQDSCRVRRAVLAATCMFHRFALVTLFRHHHCSRLMSLLLLLPCAAG